MSSKNSKNQIQIDENLQNLGTRQCLFGENHQIKQICEVVRKIARSSGTVLIRGESGTGKEVLAKAIHNQSPRANFPFLAINAAAIPPELFESELFGHTKGSFTGADKDKPGKFDEANNGTLFLDEIGDLAINHQVKLLRVLQTGEVLPVGANKPHKVNTRVIAATNKNLEQLVKEGKFREDLYFRLNLFSITIPPLRDRKDDILPLAYHFLKIFLKQQNRSLPNRFTQEVEKLLLEYSWPGNIRELENCIHFAVTMCETECVEIHDLPEHIRLCRSPFTLTAHAVSKSKNLPDINLNQTSHNLGFSSNSQTSSNSNQPIIKLPTLESEIKNLSEIEKIYILAAYKAANYNKSRAAKLLGISLRSLQMKIKKWSQYLIDENK